MGTFSNLFRRLVDAFRPSADALRMTAAFEGSAASPPPPMLIVPEDLKRAVDEENRREAAEGEPE